MLCRQTAKPFAEIRRFTQTLHCKVHMYMYVDDTVIFLGSNNVDDINYHKINEDLAAQHKWFHDNHLSLNVPKTKFMIHIVQLHSENAL